MLGRKSRAAALLVKRTIGNLVRGTVLHRDHINPYVAVYHANYACNAACSFCSRASDIAGARKGEEIGLEELNIIFRGIFSLVPSLYVAGGEPLLQRNIEPMLELARDIGFWPVAVNTNATLLDQRPDVLRFSDKIVVSIHSTDVTAAAEIFQIKRRLAERMFDNIRNGAVEARRHGNQLIGNCVLTPANVESAYRVLDFCLEHGITLAVVPAVEDYWPTIEKGGHRVRLAYDRFMERIIAEKRKNPEAIQGSMRFLERIRALAAFACHPTGIVSIDPHGHVMKPCEYKYPAMPHNLGQISSTLSAAAILREMLDYQATFQSCDRRCLKACYTEPAMTLETPLGAILEFLPLPWLRDLGRGE